MYILVIIALSILLFSAFKSRQQKVIEACHCKITPLQKLTHAITEHVINDANEANRLEMVQNICPLTKNVKGFDNDWESMRWVFGMLQKYRIRYVLKGGLLFPILRYGDVAIHSLENDKGIWQADSDIDFMLLDPPNDVFKKIGEECIKAGFINLHRGRTCKMPENHRLKEFGFGTTFTNACKPGWTYDCHYNTGEEPPELGPYAVKYNAQPYQWFPIEVVWPPRKAKVHNFTVMVPRDPLRLLSIQAAWRSPIPRISEYGIGCTGAAYPTGILVGKAAAPKNVKKISGYLIARQYEKALHDCSKALDIYGFASFFHECYLFDGKYDTKVKDVIPTVSKFVRETDKILRKRLPNNFKKCGSYWIHMRGKNQSTFICPKKAGLVQLSTVNKEHILVEVDDLI